MRTRSTLGAAAGLAILASIAGVAVSSHLVTAATPLDAKRVVARDSALLQLRTGNLPISPNTTRGYFAAVRAASVPVDGFALFARPLSAEDRRLLDAHGITVLDFAHSLIYRVRIRRAPDPADSAVSTLLLAAAQLRPQDRVMPEIWNGKYNVFRAPAPAPRTDTINYLLAGGDSLRLRVSVRRGTSETDVQRLLDAAGNGAARINAHQWRVTVTRDRLAALATPVWVEWIDAVIPRHADTDVVRGMIGVDGVQDFSTVDGSSHKYGGSGINVGVFDNGIDAKHTDFEKLVGGFDSGVSRVIDVAMGGHVSLHGTMVAAIIGGNGKNSDGTFNGPSGVTSNGTTAYQWRGMAPEAQLLGVYNGDALVNDTYALRDMFQKLIADNAMDLSNHSYSVEASDAYGFFAAQRDSLIRGDATTADGTKIPPRLQILSAGNLGPNGYFSINPGSVKNAVMVGSWRTSNQISNTSSVGPTMDGRIKPDILAPGSPVKTAGYWDGPESAAPIGTCLSGSLPPGMLMTTAVFHNFYTADCGTSLAAAVTTGVAAELLQQMRDELKMDLRLAPPLPSTLRGILLHSAGDVAGATGDPYPNGDPITSFRGPDVSTGFGLLNAAAASDIVSNQLFRTGTITGNCAKQTYDFTVHAQGRGNPTVKVTLAWDDPAAEPLLAPEKTFLVNDLDLVLVDPMGTSHYPSLVNQVIKNTAGFALLPQEQACGGIDNIVIERVLSSTETLTSAKLASAHGTMGPDHLNNVEQVTATGPAGKWRAIVTGFSVPMGPQTFSLIGVPFPSWVTVCALRVGFCHYVVANLCVRFPAICERQLRWPIWPTGPRFSFRSPDDRVIFEMSPLCEQASPSGHCLADSTNAGYSVTMASAAKPVGVEIFSQDGERVAGTGQPLSTTRLAFHPKRDTRYFMVLTPPSSVRSGVTYEPNLTVKALRR